MFELNDESNTESTRWQCPICRSEDDLIDVQPWENERDARLFWTANIAADCRTLSDNNVASPIPAATRPVTSNTTSARTYLPDFLAKTARKSAVPRKPAVPKRLSTQAKPGEEPLGSADPIIVTESEDVPAPSRSKRSQRKSVVPQSKSTNGRGKTQGLQHDDPIDLEPPDSVPDVSDVEMSIPAPRPRSSPNELSPVSAKEENLQRKLLQASFPSEPNTIATR